MTLLGLTLISPLCKTFRSEGFALFTTDKLLGIKEGNIPRDSHIGPIRWVHPYLATGIVCCATYLLFFFNHEDCDKFSFYDLGFSCDFKALVWSD